MGVGIGVRMLVSLVLTTATKSLGRYAGAGGGVLVANRVTLFAAEAFLFGMIFKFLPNTTLHWRDVATGAVLTAVLFTLGKFLIGM